ALGRGKQPCDDLQKGGLAAAGRTEKAGQAPGLEFEIDVPERDHVRPVDLRNIPDLDDAAGSGPGLQDRIGFRNLHCTLRSGRKSRISTRCRTPTAITANSTIETTAAYMCA